MKFDFTHKTINADADAPVARMEIEGEPILLDPNEDGTYKVLMKDAKRYRMFPRVMVCLDVLTAYDEEVDDEIYMKTMDDDAWNRWWARRTLSTGGDSE